MARYRFSVSEMTRWFSRRGLRLQQWKGRLTPTSYAHLHACTVEHVCPQHTPNIQNKQINLKKTEEKNHKETIEENILTSASSLCSCLHR